MDSEARLQRALGASAAPARDTGFTMAVMRAAENRRFRLAAFLGLLRGAGLAAVGAALVVPFLGWAPVSMGPLQSGVFAAGALLSLLLTARLTSQRVAGALRK